MITFHVHCRLRDGQSDEAERLIVDLVATVERKETDAVFYAFFRSMSDPLEVVLVESYSSNEAFMAHNGSSYMVAFRERFTELFDPSINEVTTLQGIAGFGRAWSSAREACVVS